MREAASTLKSNTTPGDGQDDDGVGVCRMPVDGSRCNCAFPTTASIPVQQFTVKVEF